MRIPATRPVLTAALAIVCLHACAHGEEPPVVRGAKALALERAERETFVAAHNAARKAVGVEPVVWSDDLAAYVLESLLKQQEKLIADAQEGWSKGKIALPAHRMDFKHGENVAGWAGTGGRVQGADFAVQLWLREKVAFDRLNAKSPYRVGDEKAAEEKEQQDAKEKEKKKPDPIIVGHYTQIVWRETKHIGAAQLTFELVDEQGTSRHYLAIVCNYDPPGNRLGEKPF